MKWLLSAVFLLSLAVGFWWQTRTVSPTSTSTSVSWELADVRELGELRLLSTEISSYQTVTTLDPERFLKVVIPVRVTLGMDLSQATIERTPEHLTITLPTVRFLNRSSDPRRWSIWEQRGAVLAAGETVSLPQLAEMQAFHAADQECIALNLIERTRARARTVVEAWVTGLGAPVGTVEIR